MKATIGVAILICMLAGCTRVRVHEVKSTISPRISTAPIKSYELNKERTAYIGQAIVKWQEADLDSSKISTDKYIVSTGDFKLQGRYQKNFLLGNSVKLDGKKGEIFKIAGSISLDGIAYYVAVPNDKETSSCCALLFDLEGHLNHRAITDEHFDTIMRSDNAELTPSEASFVVRSDTSNKGELLLGLSHELVYGGINDVTMNVSYREYSPSDQARQAFYQNLVYVPKIDIIRFRDFRIKVHEATNEKIVYTVLEDGL